jgi:hypothetical protein
MGLRIVRVRMRVRRLMLVMGGGRRYSLGIWSVGGKQKKKGKVEVVEKASLTSLRGLNLGVTLGLDARLEMYRFEGSDLLIPLIIISRLHLDHISLTQAVILATVV